MKTSRVQELLENVREAVAVHKGEKHPDRIYISEELDIRAIRQRFKFSQSKFAAMLGISKRTLENWEQGTRKPTGAARRLLEVAARFPEAVYQTVFDKKVARKYNPDGSVTLVIARPAERSNNGDRSNLSNENGITELDVRYHLRSLISDSLKISAQDLAADHIVGTIVSSGGAIHPIILQAAQETTALPISRVANV